MSVSLVPHLISTPLDSQRVLLGMTIYMTTIIMGTHTFNPDQAEGGNS